MSPSLDSSAEPAPPDFAGRDLSSRPELRQQVPQRIANLPWVPTWIILVSLSAAAASVLVILIGTGRGFFAPTLASAVCLLAALFDGFTARIPNPLTYTAILLGLFLSGLSALLGLLHAHAAVTWLAAPGIGDSLLGAGVFLAIFVLCVLLNFTSSGGDLKLMIGLAALLGFWQFANVLVLALTIGVIYGLINLALLGRLNVLARSLALRRLELYYLRRFSTVEGSALDHPARQVPMAIPLAIGLIGAQVFTIQRLLAAAGVTR